VGLLVAILPHMTAILFGRYVLKMNPVILLGSCCGAGTITADCERSRKKRRASCGARVHGALPLGNILLTAWGPVIVAILS